MLRLPIKRIEDYEKPAPKTFAPAPDELIEGDVILVDAYTDQVLGASVRLEGMDELLGDMGRYLRLRMDWDDGIGSSSQSRLSGIRTVSRVFGFTEPKPLRRRYGASAAAIHRQHPAMTGYLEAVTPALWELFERVSPFQAAEHELLVDGNIHQDWHFAGSPWTGGIINNRSILPYHRDAGNVKDTWSAMLAIRKGVDGGHLHLPEYGITLDIPHASVTIFNGQATWHGVTPFAHREGGHRFTLVWYAKRGLMQCGAAADEAQRAAVKATK